MPVKKPLVKILSFLPTILVVATALSANRGGAQRFGSFYIMAGLSLFLILLLQLRLLRRTTANREDLLWLVMPFIFLVGTFGTVAATSAGIGIFFALFAGYLFYFYHRHFPSPIPLYIEQTFTLYGAFLLAVFLWSLNFFFTPPWWITSLLMCAGFFPLFWQAFYKMGQQGSEAALYALVMALVMMEVAWTVLFWPVHFFTSAVMSFSAFYLIYMLAMFYFKGRLNRRKVYFQVSLISIVVLVTLASSSWQPISRI
ncbi:MAG: hypothetical protein A3C85_00925 [Candidatus Doudnabacteria bacterium RIFCSPHIGHO2_02_FULL_48_21]|uniref:Uncharacterized protein n=1 Tax=Candidatus Doudnabacteria bacterium RIFCSPLOWO2_02_FULL_48_13 TaxID=1817845 RepID=A0A1F5Q8D7_9BACT|nr:MAG: hypothetical protein A3K05_04665 [Candidatus Doudnabacteria bacterium RIFCSPHIGHO2_01_48_18]OGE79873.1 MAG: hypothetical protein A2668_04625 [Candidatus Doudnabacteria bacterium RIFCSPHIGHO2_01_FULL_48_180]OGE91050.1 MAG: hypothetical protein A3F44_01860 [Candidatus Doudnabacteria bacterium RIFCSPHIGHO2_12_FULL_47_25]OGE94036.1 MAG: hypothetical protein A3C85_00925 [Candidatus Doudnabacteria bacterium RIFCSPHIGHO2_02_FULL_48_21]OGE98048.1 MAG: hypothetical protein A3A83_03590 [Candidatu